MKNWTIKSAVSLGWSKNNVRFDVEKNGVRSLRPMQKDGIRRIGKSHHSLIVAPTGSGKTGLIQCLSSLQTESEAVRKSIVLVPQTIIGLGSCSDVSYQKGRSVLEWRVAPKYRLVDSEVVIGSRSDGVLSFLRSKHCRYLVCTYPSFLNAFGKMSVRERKRLLKDVRVWIDECHHLKVHNGDTALCNELGKVVSEIMDKIPRCRIGMATATFFRGDLNSIFPDEVLSRFDRFEYPWDRYMEALPNLESFDYSIVPYNTHPKKTRRYEPAEFVAHLFNKSRAKTLVHIPNVNTKCSHGKQYEVKRILKALGTGTMREDRDGVIQVKRKNGSVLRVIDLVKEEGRNRKKAFIYAGAEGIDLIIALGMFKEGADWPPVERSVIIGYRNSLLELLQMIGRLFRDVPGKKHVQVYHCLECTLNMHSKKFEDDLNNVAKALFGAMLLENVMCPVRVYKRKKGTAGSGQIVRDYLSEAVSMDKRQDFLAAVQGRTLARIEGDKEESDDIGKFYDAEFHAIVREELQSRGCSTKYVKKVAEQVWRMFARNRLKMRGLDVGHVDLKIVKRIHPASGMVRFVTGKWTGNGLAGIRNAYMKPRQVRDAKWERLSERCLAFQEGRVADFKRKGKKWKPEDIRPSYDSYDWKECEIAIWLEEEEAKNRRCDCGRVCERKDVCPNCGRGGQ